jgi:hypothetical protein
MTTGASRFGTPSDDTYGAKSVKKWPSVSLKRRARRRLKEGMDYDSQQDFYILPWIKHLDGNTPNHPTEYYVTPDKNHQDWHCSCQDTEYGIYRRKCSHILAAMMFTGEFHDS